MTLALLAHLFDTLAVLLIVALSLMMARRYPAAFLKYWILAQLCGLVLLFFSLFPEHLDQAPLVFLMLLAAGGKGWCYASIAEEASPSLFPRKLLAGTILLSVLLSMGFWLWHFPHPLVALLPTLWIVGGIIRFGVALLGPNRLFQHEHARWLGWTSILYGVLSVFYPITHVYLPWLASLTGTTLLLAISMGMIVFLLEENEFQLDLANQERLEALTEANRIKDEFLSVVSHELRTPLNAILGFGSALEDGLAGPLSEEQQDFLSKMLRSSEQMSRLVDDLLVLARMRSNHFELFPEEESFPSIVEEARNLTENLAKGRNIEIATDIRVSEPLRLDRARILQVLANLIGNALKFTPPGGRVEVRAWKEEDFLVAEVADNGIGMRPEDIPKLFQPFQQLDMSLVREVGGTGLGLSICKGIVQAHGGEIAVESTGPGLGTTFRFTLPAGAE
ncbi:MAG: sensor histidine kinase [Bacteroidota bacterium]